MRGRSSRNDFLREALFSKCFFKRASLCALQASPTAYSNFRFLPCSNSCYHQLQCAECAAYIETELAEVIEKRPGVLHIAVPIPLPDQLVADLNKQEDGIPTKELPSPPPLPGSAFHFNKKVAANIEGTKDQHTSELDQLRTRLVELEAQLAVKGKKDARNVSTRLLKQEICELKERIAGLERP
jgi:hypothetical protein